MSARTNIRSGSQNAIRIFFAKAPRTSEPISVARREVPGLSPQVEMQQEMKRTSVAFVSNGFFLKVLSDDE